MSDRNALKAAAEAAMAARPINGQIDQIEHANNVFEGMARPAVVHELICQLERREDGPMCWTCGDQGHVHRIDGEYLGTCDQCNVYELSCVKHELAQAKQVIADHLAPVSANTQCRRERWLTNIADAIKFGLPSRLRTRLEYTEKEIRSSIRYGGSKHRARDELERVKLSLDDPEAVFTNMKAGKIAKPSIRSMVDLYGEVLNGDEAQLLEIAKLRGEVERLGEEYDKAWRHDLNDKSNVQVLTDEVVRLTAEVERLKPDADRYQWLRDIAKMRFKPSGSSTVVKTAAATDAAIDEEMRKELPQ